MSRAWLLLLSGGVCLAQSKVSPQTPHRMEVVLEKREANAWKTIDPGLVLNKNEKVRFRFKANFNGFLYVTNVGSGGSSTLLFPRQDTGTMNRIVAGKEYLVPATTGSFRIDGPEGHDVVTWMVSPVELTRPTPATEPQAVDTSTLKPRCDDAIFKARGQCVDTGAGPRQPEHETRSLVIIKDKKASVISSPEPLTGPVTYEFRLAHR